MPEKNPGERKKLFKSFFLSPGPPLFFPKLFVVERQRARLRDGILFIGLSCGGNGLGLFVRDLAAVNPDNMGGSNPSDFYLP